LAQGDCQRRERSAADSVDLASDMQSLGQYYTLRNRPTDAVPLLKRALEIRIKTLGPTALESKETMQTYATALRLLNRVPEAEELESKAKGPASTNPTGAR